jgi:hypothetical protein
MSKRPAFQFYPGDWRIDPGLRLCSIAARGLWIEMMCLMHEGEPYGHLTAQGRAMTPESLARLVGEPKAAITRWLAELELNDVFSRTEAGVIFSRRMVRDEQVREARAAGGKEGAAHGQKGAKHGAKGGRPRNEETPLKTPLADEQRGVRKPPPSSSSSSPSSEEKVPLSDDNGRNDESKAFWDTAKSYLGKHKRDPSSLIGKWLRDHGKTETARAITAAQIEHAMDPIQYIEGYFRRQGARVSASQEMPC